jgi:DNA replication protein DnaC
MVIHTHLAIAIGVLACWRMPPVGFFTASGLIMSLKEGQADNRLDRELTAIGKVESVIVDELGCPTIDIDGADSCFRASRIATRRGVSSSPSNLESGRRGNMFGDGGMAADLNRLRHPPRQDHRVRWRVLPKHTFTYEQLKQPQ